LKPASKFQETGMPMVEIRMQHTDYAIATYYIIATAERVPTWPGMTACAKVCAWMTIPCLEMDRKTRGA